MEAVATEERAGTKAHERYSAGGKRGNVKIIPIRTIDGDDIRKRALTNLRLRLGREPTAEDIARERTAEAQRQPMAYLIHVPPAVKVSV